MNCLIFTNARKASKYFKYLFKHLGWHYSSPGESPFSPSEEWLYNRFSSLRKGIKGISGICRGGGYICVTKIGHNRFIYGLNTESEAEYKRCLG